MRRGQGQQPKSKTSTFCITITGFCSAAVLVWLLALSNMDMNDIPLHLLLDSNESGPMRATQSESPSSDHMIYQKDVVEELNPLFSLKPLTKSLHPKWKLWTEMTPTQQQDALDEVGTYLKKYGSIMGRHKSKFHGTCEMDKDIGSTGHKVCGPKPEGPCTFVSFGINDDPSWDREMASTWGCRGFAGDPTVHHPSKLHDKVTFHNIGASMLMDNEERKINKGGGEEWWSTSMPKLRYFLGVEELEIVKLDCEGCEVALARDILREDPTYLFHVKQISIETHVTKVWLDTTEHVYYLGLMFALLEEAGFVMEWSSVFGCSKRHEVAGCMPELEKYGFPCGYSPWPGHPKVVKGYSCHEFTWKRYPEKAQKQ